MPVLSFRSALTALAVSILSVGAAAGPATSAPVAGDAGSPAASPTTAQASTSRSVSFVAAAHSSPGSARFKSVTVPAAARTGDRALLMVTHATGVSWAGPSGIAGWHQVASTRANGLVSSVYAKTLAPGDLRGSVRFDSPAYAKAMLTVAVYAGVSRRASLTAVAGSDRGTTRHVTPAVTASSGDRVVSYWADHQSSTTSWTTSEATTRDTAIGTGDGRYGALLADSAAPRSGGAVPGRAASTNRATDAVTWTVRLSAGSRPLAPPPPPPTSTKVSKLLVIVEENETTAAYEQMPYLKGLSNTYGKATSYVGLVHPSLGNYFAMVSGQGTATCGLGDPLPDRCPQAGPTVFGRALSAGKTAKTYAESMVTACQTTNSTGYAARHNPWVYFRDERASCAAHSVPLGTTNSGALRSDIAAGALPNAGLIVPNLQHDAHDGTLGQADAWLHTWMAQIMAGPDYRSGRLAVVIAFDEGSGANQNVPFVMVHRSAAKKVVSARYTHFGLSRLYSDVLGVSPLGAASTEPGLGASFGL